MNTLNDIITYVRRIIKTPSNADISDNLIIDYINRFWIMDVDASLQLFDLKTKYQFITTPGVDKYNMPLYSVQSGNTNNPISSVDLYPVYQGFLGPAFINGIPVQFETLKSKFYNTYPNVVQGPSIVGIGNGTNGPYSLTFPLFPNNSTPSNPPINSLLRGHVDMMGIVATDNNIDPLEANSLSFSSFLEQIPTTSIEPAIYITSIGVDGSNVVVSDSGIFLSGNVNYGMLMVPGSAPYGNSIISTGGYSTSVNTINYLTGSCTLYFNENIPSGVDILMQGYFFQSGLPRSILYYNNTLTLRVPPASQYLVELDAYLTPAAFFNTNAAIPFAYMSEYIARGAARKILSDTGDVEQFAFYEPLFREQEALVHIRSQRQFTSTRTPTIYSQGMQSSSAYGPNNSFGGSL